MKCEYCGKPVEKGDTSCHKCGAPVVVVSEKPKTSEFLSYPFFYRGFILWIEHDYSRDDFKYYIYLGDRLVGNFVITRIMTEEWDKARPFCSIEPLIYKLLRLAIGETEVERIESQNKERILEYEIRAIETPALLEARKLIAELS